MAETLKRISTVYVEAEDRIRLTGEVDNGPPIVIWLTHPLFRRLVPPLVQWLEREAPSLRSSDVLQDFAQTAARTALKPQQPVRAKIDGPVWLAAVVDISMSKKRVNLTFKGRDGQAAALGLASTPLRQWLSIVHRAWSKSQWPQDLWPDWIKDDVPSKQQHLTLH